LERPPIRGPLVPFLPFLLFLTWGILGEFGQGGGFLLAKNIYAGFFGLNLISTSFI